MGYKRHSNSSKHSPMNGTAEKRPKVNGKNEATPSSAIPLGKRQFVAEHSELTFADMGGCEAQFLEATYLLMHLKQPQLYAQMGLAPPKGLLLHGPPGCGKSTFARAIAGLKKEIKKIQ
jgi:ATP-dependent 26S proteasome regulatory subunit